MFAGIIYTNIFSLKKCLGSIGTGLYLLWVALVIAVGRIDGALRMGIEEGRQ